MALFDASIQLTNGHVPRSLSREHAISLVLTAIQAEVGAGRISINWDESLKADLPVVIVEESNSGIRLDEGARSRLEALLLAKIRRALFPGIRIVDKDFSPDDRSK